MDDSAAGQLELPLTVFDENDGEAVITIPKEKSADFSKVRGASLDKAETRASAVRPASQADEKESADAATTTFTWRGLLVGCAVGTAAAAVIMMALHTIG